MFEEIVFLTFCLTTIVLVAIVYKEDTLAKDAIASLRTLGERSIFLFQQILKSEDEPNAGSTFYPGAQPSLIANMEEKKPKNITN